MRGLPFTRIAAVLLGAAVLSPGVVVLLRAGQPLGGVVFVLLFALYVAGVASVAWGLRSASGAALVGAVVAAPWLYYFGTEAGTWVYLIAFPEYLLLAGVGWFGWRREKRLAVSLPGVLIPTLAVAYGLLAPFVRGYHP